MLTLVCFCLVGASAQVSDSFLVPIPVDSLAAWVARNPSTIARAAGSQVLWRRGNQFAVSRRTPRGEVRAVMQDEIQRVQGGYRYTCNLVHGSSSEVESYRLDCTLTQARIGQSLLSIRVQSSVSLRVRDFQLERQMRQSVEKVRQLFESLTPNDRRAK